MFELVIKFELNEQKPKHLNLSSGFP